MKKYTANFSFRAGSQPLPECTEIEFEANSLTAAKRAAKTHAAAQRDAKGNPWRLLDVWETEQGSTPDVQAWTDAIASAASRESVRQSDTRKPSTKRSRPRLQPSCSHPQERTHG